MHSKKRVILRSLLVSLAMMGGLALGDHEDQVRAGNAQIDELATSIWTHSRIFGSQYHHNVVDNILWTASNTRLREVMLHAVDLAVPHLADDQYLFSNLLSFSIRCGDPVVQQHVVDALKKIANSHPPKVTRGLFGRLGPQIPSVAYLSIIYIGEIGTLGRSHAVTQNALEYLEGLQSDPYYWNGNFYSGGSISFLPIGGGPAHSSPARAHISARCRDLRAVLARGVGTPHKSGGSAGTTHE